jgi:hypothetical protein
LLVLGGTKGSLDPSFLKEYDVVLPELFLHVFVESAYLGPLVHDLRGENSFRPVDQEEQGLSGGPTWCGPVCPKDWLEMFRPLLAVVLQVFEGPSLEPLEDLGVGPFGLAVALGMMRRGVADLDAHVLAVSFE